jgi:hypothetical protein
MRGVMLVVTLVFAGALLALTVHATIQDGFDVLTVLSALVLALLVFGIVGALLHPPHE